MNEVEGPEANGAQSALSLQYWRRPPILEAQSTLCFTDFRAFFFLLHSFWSSTEHVADEVDYPCRKKSDPAHAENRVKRAINVSKFSEL